MSGLLEFGTTPFVDLLPTRLRAALGDIAVRRQYANGQLIHGRGDRKAGLSIVISGAVRICNAGSDGSQVTTAVLGPGQCFGEFTLLSDLPRTHDAIATGATTIDQIGKPAFETLSAAEPDLLRLLAGATANRLHRVLELLDDIRRLPLPVLLAKTLLVAADRDATVSCSQAELADALGVSRVTIGQALAGFEEDALLARRYGRIELTNVEELARWVAERDVLFRLPEH